MKTIFSVALFCIFYSLCSFSQITKYKESIFSGKEVVTAIDNSIIKLDELVGANGVILIVIDDFETVKKEKHNFSDLLAISKRAEIHMVFAGNGDFVKNLPIKNNSKLLSSIVFKDKASVGLKNNFIYLLDSKMQISFEGNYDFENENALMHLMMEKFVKHDHVQTITTEYIENQSIFKQTADEECGFEDGVFGVWNGFKGTCSAGTNGSVTFSLPSTGINLVSGVNPSNQLNAGPWDPSASYSSFLTGKSFTLLDSIGYDPNTFVDKVLPIDSMISFVAPGGGNYSIRLGNSNVSRGADRISKTFLVTADKTNFTYQYALLLHSPSFGPHSPNEQSAFNLRILNASGQQIGGSCGAYSVYAGQNSSGFIEYVMPDSIEEVSAFEFAGGDYLYYKPWTSVGIDLTPYIGQTITVEFTINDCSAGGHFGYAYIDYSCSASEITTYLCPGDPSISLSAPVGFVSYEWKNIANVVVGNTQNITVQNPKIGDEYTVSMTNAAGCATAIKTILAFNPPLDVPDYLVKQNVMTPNNDGINDKFVTSQFKYVQDFSIKIYNRWGLEVFSSEIYTNEWDGKLSNGSIAEDGTYFYHLKYTSACVLEADKKPFESKGFITLLRK